MNELAYQAKKIVQAGKQTWWDTQKFQEVVPYGVGYECKAELGETDTLKGHGCKETSFRFLNMEETPVINGVRPFVFRSGKQDSQYESKVWALIANPTVR